MLAEQQYGELKMEREIKFRMWVKSEKLLYIEPTIQYGEYFLNELGKNSW